MTGLNMPTIGELETMGEIRGLLAEIDRRARRRHRLRRWARWFTRWPLAAVTCGRRP
jgi:hypothetical protein